MLDFKIGNRNARKPSFSVGALWGVFKLIARLIFALAGNKLDI